MVSLIDSKKFEKNILYMISQSINIGGDWDWEKQTPPEGIKVLETIRNPLGEPLFYLVSKSE